MLRTPVIPRMPLSPRCPARELRAAYRHDRTVTRETPHDEHGLILRVRASGSKHWIWRGTVRARRRDLGLGTFPYVSLAEAREKAFESRRLAKAGEDPAAVRAPEGTNEVEPKSNTPTFRKAAAAVIELHRPTWRNPKSAAQWKASLRDYAFPVLEDMRSGGRGLGRGRETAAERPRVPIGDRAAHERQHALETASRPRNRGRSPRVPVELSRLVRGDRAVARTR